MLTIAALALLPIASVLPSLRVIPIPEAFAQNTPVLNELYDSAGMRQPLRLQLPVLLCAIWTAGMLVHLIRIARSHHRAHRIIAGADRSHSLPLDVDYPVFLSTDVSFAFSYGLRRPVIVLPKEAATWSHVDVQSTLVHEAAHISRNDAISLLLSELAVAFYWWHPGVSLIARCAAAERERACDDAVLGSGIRPSDYGSHLLHQRICSSQVPGPLATALLSHSDGLAARIERILDVRLDRSVITGRRTLAISMLAFSVALLVATASPAVTVMQETISLSPLSSNPVFVVAPILVKSRLRAGRRASATPAARRIVRESSLSEAPDSLVPSGALPPLLGKVKRVAPLAKEMGTIAAQMGSIAAEMGRVASERPYGVLDHDVHRPGAGRY
jgi:hypothetical protein